MVEDRPLQKAAELNSHSAKRAKCQCKALQGQARAAPKLEPREKARLGQPQQTAQAS